MVISMWLFAIFSFVGGLGLGTLLLRYNSLHGFSIFEIADQFQNFVTFEKQIKINFFSNLLNFQF